MLHSSTRYRSITVLCYGTFMSASTTPSTILISASPGASWPTSANSRRLCLPGRSEFRSSMTLRCRRVVAPPPAPLSLHPSPLLLRHGPSSTVSGVTGLTSVTVCWRVSRVWNPVRRRSTSRDLCRLCVAWSTSFVINNEWTLAKSQQLDQWFPTGGKFPPGGKFWCPRGKFWSCWKYKYCSQYCPHQYSC